MNTFENGSGGSGRQLQADDEISLVEIFGKLWQHRWLLVAITLLAGVMAAIVAFILPIQYESTVLLSPVSDDNDGSRFSGASALLSQYGGLSALGGFNFSSSSRKSEALATLQSRALTETYIQEKNLLPILYPKLWDSAKGQWKDHDPKKQPTLWKAEKLFRTGVREVIDDKKSGLIKVTITWTDPKIAAEWANDLVSRTNQYLRQRASEQSNRNIAYLNDQLTRTSVVELQKAIYSLIEAEIKKVMIAQGSDEYAFKIIDLAVPAEQKSKPNRKLIVAIGLVLGFFLASVSVLLFRSSIIKPSTTFAR